MLFLFFKTDIFSEKNAQIIAAAMQDAVYIDFIPDPLSFLSAPFLFEIYFDLKSFILHS